MSGIRFYLRYPFAIFGSRCHKSSLPNSMIQTDNDKCSRQCNTGLGVRGGIPPEPDCGPMMGGLYFFRHK